MRRELERIEIPGEHEARERSRAVVAAAFAERQPQPRRRAWKPIAAIAVVAVTLAGLLSPPGRAVLDEIREAVGVESSTPALFSLPAPGRLLVTSDAGAWVAENDGSKRLLGNYGEAAWSPFGRFVAVTRANELAAVQPDGRVRWSLARPDVRFPRWHGTRTDTRIAYLTTSRLHVVGGNGKQDADAGGMPAAARVAPAWRHGVGHVLAYADARGRVTVYDSDAGSVQFRTGRLPNPRALDWSSTGRLLVVTDAGIELWGGQGQRTARRELPGVLAAAFSPDGSSIAVLRRSELLVLNSARLRSGRRVFAGAGPFAGLAWSPNGRWLLLGWPAADQWIFVAARAKQQVRAIGNVSSQFRSRSFPTIQGWCCSP